jgi:hypothetical protein
VLRKLLQRRKKLESMHKKELKEVQLKGTQKDTLEKQISLVKEKIEVTSRLIQLKLFRQRRKLRKF